MTLKSGMMFDKLDTETACKKVRRLVRADCDVNSHHMM
jgi:hypothetical protein